MQVNLKSLLSTTKTWTTVKSADSGCRQLHTLVDRHREQMEELVEFDKERWKDLLKHYVVDKEWGEKRTMQQLEEYLEFEDKEREWIEKWIEIYRQVRLEGYTVEKARKIVEHEIDPAQRKL